ncbi:hypothetical protein ISN45_Aa03g033780 [Arabidopsis thaliana x Arabidopsis arenosa]|uniref:Uncharacterized protein n=1 Tax=Arabidopsis thaliana x Arabidopsis arenosa TaxID=1240361 RepID=A0A8T2B2I9_9BRAS|nr:hypothetical protein ISN45_Aa03g033780 [Arabidopsis thaliana x Arabidopsis arenosa]
MSSDSDRPESPSYDGKRSSLDDCTRPNDIAGPHYRSTCTIQSLQRLKELCRLPPDVMAESKMADPTESPEDHRDGYFCVYEIYFKGCGLTFPLPEALVRLSDVLPSKWSAKPAFIAPILPTEEFVNFFKTILRGETLWNSFTLDRFIEANRKLRMSPPITFIVFRLLLNSGLSARALTAQRKKLSKPIAEACDENKAFLAAAIDKKGLQQDLTAILLRIGEIEGPDDRSPRSSPPSKTMGPPAPVDMSSLPDMMARRPLGAYLLRRKVLDLKMLLRSQNLLLSPKSDRLQTRSGLILPEFDKWRPAIRERYLLHAHHSSRANSELNDMVEHYEGLLLSQQQEIEWRGKFTTLESDLHSSSGSKQQLEDQVVGLKSELEKIKGDLKDQYDQNTNTERAFWCSSETEGVVLSEVPAAPKADQALLSWNARSGLGLTRVPHFGFSQLGLSTNNRRLCDERQRLGLKRQTLEARIARVERKVRALESDPFQWEWRNFDSIAEIPRMLRMYLRAKGQVQGPVNAPTEVAPIDSEEEDEENDDNPWKRMEFNLRCSESMPDFSRIGMINDGVPNEPNRQSPPPRGFFRSQIRAPCALIRNLPTRDQGTAMAFIEALALQHRKLTLEKKRLRKRINRMQRRLTTVSRDLHILGSHPGEWIELGISDFARIPDCMMPVLDLAGQGVQVFCSPGGFT